MDFQYFNKSKLAEEEFKTKILKSNLKKKLLDIRIFILIQNMDQGFIYNE